MFENLFFLFSIALVCYDNDRQIYLKLNKSLPFTLLISSFCWVFPFEWPKNHLFFFAKNRNHSIELFEFIMQNPEHCENEQRYLRPQSDLLLLCRCCCCCYWWRRLFLRSSQMKSKNKSINDKPISNTMWKTNSLWAICFFLFVFYILISVEKTPLYLLSVN